MKKLLFLLFLPLVTNAQLKYNLDNSLTGSYATSKIGDQTGLVFNGLNHFEVKKTYWDINPYYSIKYTGTKKIDNELLSREDIGRWDKSISVFLVHQYNSSFIRGISADNWIGAGIGKTVKIKEHISISLSYCVQYEYRRYLNSPLETILRNSIRGRIRCDYKDVQLSVEYYFQPNIDNSNDINIFGSTSITLFNSKPVSLTFQNVYNYMSTDKVKLIQNTTAGIRVKLCKN